MASKGGISAPNRALLEKLHSGTAGPFTVQEAAQALSVDHKAALRLLPYLASRGWLSRVRRGLYTTVPLGASSPAEWREDPWLVAQRAFAPCYIGGWSACEHWGLTEQTFRDVMVFTGAPVRRAHLTIQGTGFRVRSLPKEKHFGTRPVWRGQNKVLVSDPSRTMVDLLDDPGLGGGIRHVAEILASYFGGDMRDETRLLDYAERLGNRTVFKRLGYLVEALHIPSGERLVARCAEKQSSGLSVLDPTIRRAGRVLKRWNLRLNVAVAMPQGAV